MDVTVQQVTASIRSSEPSGMSDDTDPVPDQAEPSTSARDRARQWLAARTARLSDRLSTY